jgi:hypothetical protein
MRSISLVIYDILNRGRGKIPAPIGKILALIGKILAPVGKIPALINSQ